MWISILMSVLSSDMTKQVIVLGVRKLLEYKSDGVTKDVAEAMLDGIAKSRSNNVPQEAADAVKSML